MDWIQSQGLAPWITWVLVGSACLGLTAASYFALESGPVSRAGRRLDPKKFRLLKRSVWCSVLLVSLHRGLLVLELGPSTKANAVILFVAIGIAVWVHALTSGPRWFSPRDEPDSVNRVDLRFGFQTWLPGIALLVVAIAISRSLDVALGVPGSEARWSLGLAAIAIVLPTFLLWIRQPRGASITWDDRSITEWDSEAVRTAIRWSDARVFVRTDLTNSLVEISDGQGRQILTGTDRHLLGRGRRSLLKGADLKRLIEVAEAHARPIERAEDPTPRGRFVIHPIAGKILLVAACVGYPAFVLTVTNQGGMMGLAGALGLSVLVARPWLEWRASRVAARPLAGAEKVELIPSERGLLAQAADGSKRALDLDELAHPDGLLHERSGEAWLVASSMPDDGAYRGASLTHPSALETSGTRRARQTLQLALLVEAAVRGLVAAYAWVLTIAL